MYSARDMMNVPLPALFDERWRSRINSAAAVNANITDVALIASLSKAMQRCLIAWLHDVVSRDNFNRTSLLSKLSVSARRRRRVKMIRRQKATAYIR